MTASSTRSKVSKRFAPIVCALLVVLLSATLIFGLSACNKNDNDKGSNPSDAEAFTASLKNETRVSYGGEILGTVARNIPTEVKNGGLVDSGAIKSYPTWGKSQSYNAEQKAVVINESWGLTSTTTQIGTDGKPKNTYDSMDAEGNLYLGGTKLSDMQRPTGGYAKYTPDKLYKHTAAVGLYGGNVADSEPAVIKKLTLYNRGYTSYSVTGLYAPAGEVIKVELSGADMDRTNGIRVHIGQALYNQKANNIWAQRGINRMPVILNTMVVSKSTATYDEERDVWTAYVGSFLGGPIYIQNVSSTYTVTISGAVQYRHMIFGYTTPEEFEELSKSTAPYFDLEVWERGVLHSGPLSQAKSFSYEDLYKAGILWEKISLVTAACYNNYNNNGIVFIYDCFVAAGAAVAFPGQNSVNCPSSWMSGSLNYNAFVNGGSWGNMHEYNHNFQGYGVGGGGEVTNNAMTLVSYSLFTRISRARNIANYGVSGLGGWNRYTSATWALNEVIKNSWGGNGKQGLSLYAALLHSFGQDAFIAARKQGGGQSYPAYYKAWTNVTHNDMSYFFNDILGGGVSQDVINATNGDKNYPLFVPIASVYQTGRSYTYNGTKRYFDTMQPYVIKYGEPFNVDLNKYTVSNGMYAGGSIVIPDRFDFTINSVTNQSNGTIDNLDLAGKKFTFNPGSELFSGKIIVNVSITDTKGQYNNISDVDLVLQFEQTHEMNKNVLQKDVYSYAEAGKYATAKAAYEADFAGSVSSELKVDHANPINPSTGKVVQNCNTDVWFIDKISVDSTSPNDGVVPENVKSQVVVINGKLYVNEDAKYRIAIRGRESVALYLSFDNGSNYEFAAEYNGGNNANFPLTEGTYKDYELVADTYVYFKLVLVRDWKEQRNAFAGLGWGKFVPAVYEKDADGNLVTDESGNLVIKTPEKVSVTYATAYRNSYVQNNAPFVTEYKYKRPYTYNYTNNVHLNPNQTIVDGDGFTNYVSGTSYNWKNYPISNLIDGNRSTTIHTKDNGLGISEAKKLLLTLDMGEEKTANRMVIYAQSRNDARYPKNFKLEGSLDCETFFTIGEYENMTASNWAVTANFDKEYTFRYYRLTITASSGKGINICEIEMIHSTEIMGGKKISPDSDMFSYKGDWAVKGVASDFGHVIVGKKGATMEFEFEGEYFGILSSSKFNGSFDVYIDGQKIDCTSIKEGTDISVIKYLSSKLSEGKHSVKIVCAEDNANISSIVTW